MCSPCHGCGKCKPKFTKQTCPSCWEENEVGATVCAHCGYIYPIRAGVSAKAAQGNKGGRPGPSFQM